MKNLDQRRLRGRDLPDQPQGRRDPRPQGVQERSATCPARSTSRCSRSRRSSWRRRWREVGEKGVAGRGADPLRVRRDRQPRAAGRDRGDRRTSTASGCSGPNIYGYYYTPQNLCATFCTPYDVKGGVALTSQSGGIGMAILGLRPHHQDGRLGDRRPRQQVRPRRGRPAHLLRAGPQHQRASPCTWRTSRTAGRSSRRRSAITKKKPVVVLKAGPHGDGCAGGELAHRRARRRRQGLRRHPAAGRRGPGARR